MFDIHFGFFYHIDVKGFLHLANVEANEWRIKLKSTEKKTIFHKGN